MSRVLIATETDIDLLTEEWFDDITNSFYQEDEGEIDVCFAELWEFLHRIDIENTNVFYLGVQSHINFDPIRREINSLLKNVEITEYDSMWINTKFTKTTWGEITKKELSSHPSQWRSIIFKIEISPLYNVGGKMILLKLLGVLLRATSPLESDSFVRSITSIMEPPPSCVKDFLLLYYGEEFFRRQCHNISKQRITVSQIKDLDSAEFLNNVWLDYDIYSTQSSLWEAVNLQRKRSANAQSFPF